MRSYRALSAARIAARVARHGPSSSRPKALEAGDLENLSKKVAYSRINCFDVLLSPGNAPPQTSSLAVAGNGAHDCNQATPGTLSNALRELYEGPQYANGRPASRTPILRRFCPVLQPPHLTACLTASEQEAVDTFLHACHKSGVEERAPDAMQSEFAHLVSLVAETIPALSQAGDARDHKKQRIWLGLLVHLVDGLKELADIDECAIRVVRSLST